MIDDGRMSLLSLQVSEHASDQAGGWMNRRAVNARMGKTLWRLLKREVTALLKAVTK